jgi:8-oxo-dGTP pyrophosphatase MutT (NUDIX family)
MVENLTIRRISLSPQVRRGVKALVSTGEAVLLVKEQHANGSPFWTFPGGGLEPNESSAAGLRRELREELDCGIDIGESIGTLWYAHRSNAGTLTRYDVFDCSVLSEPASNPKEGILEYRWFDPDALPARTLPQVRFLCRELPSSA